MTRTSCKYLLVSVAFTMLCCWSADLPAQMELLSAEQRQLLNQLPPSQRAAAMQQLQQFSRQSQSTSSDRQAREVPDQTVPGVLPSLLPEEVTTPPEFGPDATVIVEAAVDSNSAMRPGSDPLRLQETIRRLHEGNPYVLDTDGQLALPGINAIGLAGLSEDQASLRLSTEPALTGLSIKVTLLPLRNVGVDALEPFGYKFFDNGKGLNADAYGVPVPANFVLGPGDSLRIQLFGARNAAYELTVERDGNIQFPDLGPVNVAGVTLAEVREILSARVNEQFIGTNVSVTMGELRLIQVFLVGDVNKPGPYNVGSLSSVTSVLSSGGGVSENGTLRGIQLKRDGKLVATLDVYDLLLRGSADGDVRVQAGDVIFVPPVGKRVSIFGAVKRPAIYEYRGAASVTDIVALSGGLEADALANDIRVERIEPDTGVRTISAGAWPGGGAKLRITDGDKVFVPRGISEADGSISIVGNVQRPGTYQWREGLRLSDLLPDSRHLKPSSDLHYVLIRRELSPNTSPSLLSADLEAAWEMRGSPVDLELKPRDSVFVFDLKVGRGQFVEPLIGELQLHSSLDSPAGIVSVGGSVNATGQYPLEPGMRISDLVRAGGGLSQSAYARAAELTRYSIAPDGSRSTEIIEIRLDDALNGDLVANSPLMPFDYLNIREVPNWRGEEFVEVTGEVAFPGRYPIRQGETLSSVINRAGGLTDAAFTKGSIFTRESLRERERAQINTLADRLERDLASLSLSDPAHSVAMPHGQALLDQLRSTEPVGRLVIDLDFLTSTSNNSSITVRDGDKLYVPALVQEVTVLGEVQYATSHLYRHGERREDYIRLSGGLTARADKKRIYVVRANGRVETSSASSFFARNGSTHIEPGDTIVVPLDTDHVKPLTLWTSISQIVYNVAIAATAVSRF